MVKIRLQGTTNDIKRMKRAIARCRGLEIVNVSEILPVENSEKYHRQFMDIRFDNEKEAQIK